MNLVRSHVLVCGGTGCTSSGSEKLISEFQVQLEKAGIEKEVSVVKTGCFGLCALGPIVIVYPEGAFYSMIKPENVEEIVQEHLLKGRIVTHLLYEESAHENEEIKPLAHDYETSPVNGLTGMENVKVVFSPKADSTRSLPPSKRTNC